MPVSTSTTATWAPNGNVAWPASKRVSIVEVVALALRGDGEVGPGLGHRRRAGDVEGAVVLVEHDVGLVGLEQRCGQLLGLLDQLDRRLVDRGAALLQRARPHRAAALGHEVGVAPDQGDLVHRDAGLVAGDHRPRRVVALTVRRGAGVHERGPVVLHLDLRRFAHRVDAAGDLDVDADADAELLVVAGLAAAGLLGAQRRCSRRPRAPCRALPRSRRRRRPGRSRWCAARGTSGSGSSAGPRRDPCRSRRRTGPSPARRQRSPRAVRRRDRGPSASCWSARRWRGPRCSGCRTPPRPSGGSSRSRARRRRP